MDAIGYRGGLRFDSFDRPPQPAAWRCLHDDVELFLTASGDCPFLFQDGVGVLLRGTVYEAGQDQPTAPAEFADQVRAHYRRHGDLPVERLDGAFTVALLDARAGRVLLYRNLVGNGFTYYTVAADGFHFGSNLPSLVDASGVPPRPNAAVLPLLFLYRFVPGRETLFAGVQRLMPGELVRYDRGGLQREQRTTFESVAAASADRSADLVDELERTVVRALAGHAAKHPGTANLLSGGVDSSYLQAVWGLVQRGGRPAASFSVCVDHPTTRPDTEYALSAARALGADHTLVPADKPYAEYLLDALAATGEPPNHVMAVYFLPLAREMAARGVAAGLCGEGADSLFGIGSTDLVRRAAFLRTAVPHPAVRSWGARLAGALGYPYVGEAFRMADHLGRPEDLRHPVNQVACFTDLAAVEACFGADAIARAAASRRSLVDQYRAPDDLLHRMHAVGYLGEAADSASLWTTMFHAAGVELGCPFLDSRVLRFALRLPGSERFVRRQPKALLKRALARYVSKELAYRPKLGFPQPIFEWLGVGGQLRPWVEQIGQYEFVHPEVRLAALARPNWFLSTLLCYDLWHKLFIDRSLPRPRPASSGPAAVACLAR